MLVIHDEPEDASTYTAAKAMERLPARAHHEGRRFFLMKGAERLEIRSRAFQRKIRTDHFDNVVRGGDLFDCLRRNRSHARLIIFASFGFGSDVKLTQCESMSNL
jgi:hypothetical protein